MSTDRATARKAAAWANGIAALRERAKTSDRQAQAAEKFRAAMTAPRPRHIDEVDRQLAAQRQPGLDSGAYLLGKSQHPSVEAQCGCREFCR